MKNVVYAGNITNIRDLEDCIRATKKYTEGVQTMMKHHPIQGQDFPSSTFCKIYEIYPELELSWDMPAGKALDWLWGDCKIIKVVFNYDYKANKASMTLKYGNGDIKELIQTIPGFGNVLQNVYANGDSQ